jgi:hypothetical protein
VADYEPSYTITTATGIKDADSASLNYPDIGIETFTEGSNEIFDFPAFEVSAITVTKTYTFSQNATSQTQSKSEVVADPSSTANLTQGASLTGPIYTIDLINKAKPYLTGVYGSDFNLGNTTSLHTLDQYRWIGALSFGTNPNLLTGYSDNLFLDYYDLAIAITEGVAHKVAVKGELIHLPTGVYNPEDGTVLTEYEKTLNMRFWVSGYSGVSSGVHVSESLGLGQYLGDYINPDYQGEFYFKLLKYNPIYDA